MADRRSLIALFLRSTQLASSGNAFPCFVNVRRKIGGPRIKTDLRPDPGIACNGSNVAVFSFFFAGPF